MASRHPDHSPKKVHFKVPVNSDSVAGRGQIASISTLSDSETNAQRPCSTPQGALDRSVRQPRLAQSEENASRSGSSALGSASDAAVRPKYMAARVAPT